MNDVALASMQISSARLGMQYSMSMQKMSMTDMEQQAMGELEMLPPVTSGVGNFIDTYA
ncbi:MAG: putative motility protein [Oscillibacter sp.]|nr:putative motility protein [Oscillibacter sp.]